ncbi:MAG TPA: SDR family oxidoreductase [Methylomirabilota bacterium]|nr:SDR family oxidoreductase [Methylomirabilota bacterium]
MRLDGRVAIVTGASRGLGRAMAVALAGAGADVALAARSQPDLDETARLVAATGRRALAVVTDVTAYAQVEALVERTVTELGGLHVVVNNSGIARVAPLAQMSPEDFRAVLEVNLIGAFNGCRAAAAHLIAQKSGKIVNVASMLAQVGLPGYSVYSASKSGITGFTRALAVEWARHSIQVNAIAPGWFVTDMNADAFGDPRVRERLPRDVPARRTGRLDEIGPLVVYLASAASDFMTGQTLFLDGGHSAA